MSEDLLEKVAESVTDGDPDVSEEMTKKALDAGIPAKEIIFKGVMLGARLTGEKYERKEYFLSDIMLTAECIKRSMALLTPHLKTDKVKMVGKVVLGTVQGDIHDIGKDLVKNMLSASGFEVHDLGIDIPPVKFAEKAKEIDADIVAASCIITASQPYLSEIIEELKKFGVRDKVKVIYGGTAVSRTFCENIGADGFGDNAFEAVKEVEKLLKL